MNVLCGKKRAPSEDMRIDDMEFHAETLRIIQGYLKGFSDGPPAKALRCFTEHLCGGRQEDVLNRARRGFMEEIRRLLLCMLLKKGTSNRVLLKKYHLYTHLMELHFTENTCLFRKTNSFLNTNFKLRDDDFAGHACRGNLGELVRLRPDLTAAIGEFAAIKRQTHTEYNAPNFQERKILKASRLNEWRSKYSIRKDLFDILSGNYKNFNSGMEEFCYDLAYDNKTEYADPYVEILGGNFDGLANRPPGWLKLIVFLVYDKRTALREYEILFESMYFETLCIDHRVSLGFLSYSRASEYHFGAMLNRTPLDSPAMESLISFSSRSQANNQQMLHMYANILQTRGGYEHLCRLILEHSIHSFSYKKEFLVYFIKNFGRLESLAQESFTNDRTGRFVYLMHHIAGADHVSLEFLIKHEYSGWVIGDIVDKLVTCRSASDILLVKCLESVVRLGRDGAVLAPGLKARLIKKMTK